MKKANCALKGEIHRLGQAKDDLSKSGSSLKETNQKNADNLVKFQVLSDNLESMGKATSVTFLPN